MDIVHGGKAVAQFAAESEYIFKSVLMVSPFWDQKDKVVEYVDGARERGTKFYASYSEKTNTGDVEATKKFVDVTLKDHLDAEPLHLSAIAGHAQTVWDVATSDKDGDGRADIWNILFGGTSSTKPNSNQEQIPQDTVQDKPEDGVGVGAIAGAKGGILGLVNSLKKLQNNQNNEWDFTKIKYPDDYRVTEEGILLKDRYQSNHAYSWEPGWYERYMQTLWYKEGYGHIMYWQSQYGERNNGSTIQSGGCGITCATLMASELKHKIVEPNEYVKYLAVNGQSGAGDTSIQAILDDEAIKYTRTSGKDSLEKTLRNLDTDAYIVNLEKTVIHGHWTLFYYDHEKDILVQYDPDPATVLSGKVPDQNERIDNGYLSVDEIPDSTVGFVVKKDDWQQ